MANQERSFELTAHKYRNKYIRETSWWLINSLNFTILIFYGANHQISGFSSNPELQNLINFIFWVGFSASSYGGMRKIVEYDSLAVNLMDMLITGENELAVPARTFPEKWKFVQKETSFLKNS